MAVLRPPPRLTLSAWADEFAVLSAESSAEAGKWRSLPYQRGIMDAITDPRVTEVTLMKSARVGYTKIVNHTIGYYAQHDPCPIMLVQPTIEDAKDYSKEEIGPMIRDTPALCGLFSDDGESDNTILKKVFPGGSLSMVGSNSPRAFRRVSRKVILLDEVDAYPQSVGNEGDPIKLARKRSEYYWDRKIVKGSTPTFAGRSRVEREFMASDRRYYHVPCPHCGAFQVLKFARLKWPKGKPRSAVYACAECDAGIEYRYHREMMAAGKWIAERPFEGHAGFHIWAAYSYSPNSTWADIAEEFTTAERDGVETLKTFVNTVLGETWKDRGEAPDWRRIYDRRERYPIGKVPLRGLFLTAGVDVQKDRLEVEVVAWGRGKESWSVEELVFMGDTAAPDVWADLDKLLARQYEHESGIPMPIHRLAVDAGYNTQHVYTWARNYPMTRVIAVKGTDRLQVILGNPGNVDVQSGGRTVYRGYKSFPVGSSVIKSELYGWLRLDAPTDEAREAGKSYPPGYCHFPEYGENYFQQLTAEQLVSVKKKTGHSVYSWELIEGRQNHKLDCRVYARAAASAVGIDRFNNDDWTAIETGLGIERMLPQQGPDTEREETPAVSSRVPESPAKPKRQPFAARKGWLK